MGRAFIVKNADFSGSGLGTVTFVKNIPLVSLSIVCSDYLEEPTQIGVAYNPADTTQRDVVFSVESGSQYASITEAGYITILSGAVNASVTIRVTSVDDSSIYAEKTITVTFTATGDQVIPFADTNVKNILLTNGVGGVTVPGEITANEAKAVTSIGAWFNGNTTIVSFDEFRYFTGISSFAVNSATFNGCTALTSIRLPSSLSALPNGSNSTLSTFGGCTALVHVDLANVTNIGNHSFNGCSSLSDINLSKVTDFGTNSFTACQALTSMDISAAVTINNSAFNDPTHMEVASIVFGDALVTIGNGAFMNFYKTGNVVLPGSVQTYGNQNFTCGNNSYRNTVMQSFKIDEGENDLTMGNGQFNRCDALTLVDLPSNISAIAGQNWFSNRAAGAPSVTLIVRATTVPALSSAFGVSPGAIYVPDNAVSAYKADSAWGAYSSIIQPLSNYTPA